MPTWRDTRHDPPAELRLDADGATLTAGASVTRWPLDALATDAVRDAVMAALDYRVWLEVRAVAAVDDLGDAPQRPKRPLVIRDRDAGRGGPWWVHILGRRVTVRVRGLEPLALTLEEARDAPLPAPYRAALGEETADWLVGSVTALAPLPCMCHTRALSPEEHGDFRTVTSGQHPHAPIQSVTQVGYCTVCGQWWSFNEAGDSHYSFHYSARAFDPRAEVV